MITRLNKKLWLLLLGTLLSLSNNSFGNVSNDLDSFFNGLGYQSNVTSAGAYQGQAAGYYTGGSLFLRSQVKDYQIISAQMPSFSGGCSGIDSFLGSFSVINADALKKMMKNILNSSGEFAFDLALTTAVPQMRSVKDYVQKMIREVNSANINSCETAEDLVGGVWPKTQASQQQICRDVGSHHGPFSDWAAARAGCGTGGEFSKGMQDGGPRKAEVIVNKNLVWDALRTNGFIGSDQQLGEMLMSLSGSFIVRNKDGKVTKVTLPSKADSQDIIKALLHGGHAKIYQCDEEKKCLNPTTTEINIPHERGLVTQVTTMIRKLNAAVANDSGVLPPEARGFLEMTPLPLLKYITNSLALGKVLNPGEYSDIVAIGILDQYLSESIQVVQEALSQEDTPMSPKMAAQINTAQQLIALKLASSYRKLTNVNTLTQSMRANEQQLTSRLVSEASVGQETR